MAMMTVSSKGQVVLPADIRKRLGLMAGMRMEIVEEADGVRLIVARPVKAANIAASLEDQRTQATFAKLLRGEASGDSGADADARPHAHADPEAPDSDSDAQAAHADADSETHADAEALSE